MSEIQEAVVPPTHERAWKRWSVPVLVLLLAGLVVFSIAHRWNRWEGDAEDHTTDDAAVRGDVTSVSTKVPGLVDEVLVGDYQQVGKGDVLVRLEDTDYQAQVAQARAGLAAAKAALISNGRQSALQAARIDRASIQIEQARAQAAAAKAGRDSLSDDLSRTQSERIRQELLLKVDASTRQKFELASADEGRFTALARSRDADVEAANAAVAGSESAVEAERRNAAVITAARLALEADVARSEAALQLAEANLEHTVIRAPEAGTLGERQVRKGQFVAPGTQLIPLIEARLWVVANFRETQLTHVRPGDAVDVAIDQFPGQVAHGHVAEIAPASGSQFALLPPDNATGNFTKVTQRIPVKIELDPSGLVSSLRAGLSVQVTVHTAR